MATIVQEYQITDSDGKPIGPPQKFEAETEAELREKIVAAHQNAARSFYETRKRVKLENLISGDPDAPLQIFEPKQLTADDRVRIANALKDPATTQEAFDELLAARGISVDAVRRMQESEALENAKTRGKEEVQKFIKAHPEYPGSRENKDKLVAWLEKKNYALTAKNLEIAYDAIGEQLTPLAPPPIPVVTAPVPAIPAQPVVSTPAAPTVPAITEPPTTPTPISVPAVEPRPKQSSSGLGRDSGSAVPAVTPAKVTGITRRQISQMSLKEYTEKMRDSEFRKAVDALGA